jgi:hypothetical protein
MSNKGLPGHVRKAMLDEELGDGDGEVVMDTPRVEPPAPEVQPPAPVPAMPMDVQPLMQAFLTAMTQANVSTAEAIKEALGNATTLARTPIPENPIDPGKSVYSHPDGDLVTPRTPLRCDMFLGLYDDEGVAKPAFEIFEDSCTEAERVELNKLQPGVYAGIERNDGVRGLWRVVQKQDDNGQPTRLIIAVPQQWLSQEQFMQMPGQLQFLRQLNEHATPVG